MADQQNRKLQEREYRFYKEIQVKFREVVDPLTLSDYLVASCLTEDDVDRIKAKYQNDGRSKAAGELLDRLRRRPNWVYNLLLACNHPELGLDHLCNYIKDKMTQLEIRITIRCNDGHNCAGISDSINDASEEVLTQQGGGTRSDIEKILADFKSRVDPEDFVQYLTRLKEEDEEAVKCKQQQSGRLAAAEELVFLFRKNYTHWKHDLQEALKCERSGLQDLGEKLSKIEFNEWDLQTSIPSMASNSDISTEDFTKKRKERVLELVRKQVLHAKSLDEIRKVLQLAEDINASFEKLEKGSLILILSVNSIDTLEAIQRLYLGGVLIEAIRKDLLSEKRRHHILQVAQKNGAKDGDIDDSFFDSLDFDVEICPADFQFCYLNLKAIRDLSIPASPFESITAFESRWRGRGIQRSYDKSISDDETIYDKIDFPLPAIISRLLEDPFLQSRYLKIAAMFIGPLDKCCHLFVDWLFEEIKKFEKNYKYGKELWTIGSWLGSTFQFSSVEIQDRILFETKALNGKIQFHIASANTGGSPELNVEAWEEIVRDGIIEFSETHQKYRFQSPALEQYFIFKSNDSSAINIFGFLPVFQLAKNPHGLTKPLTEFDGDSKVKMEYLYLHYLVMKHKDSNNRLAALKSLIPAERIYVVDLQEEPIEPQIDVLRVLIEEQMIDAFVIVKGPDDKERWDLSSQAIKKSLLVQDIRSLISLARVLSWIGAMQIDVDAKPDRLANICVTILRKSSFTYPGHLCLKYSGASLKPSRDVEDLCTGLQLIPNVCQLDLSGTSDIEPEAYRQVIKACRFSKLSSLVLNNTILMNKEDPQPIGLQYLPHLKHLEIEGCNLGDAGIHAMSLDFKEAGQLTELSVARNKITSSGILELSGLLMEKQNLRIIRVHENDVGYEGAVSLAILFRNLPFLEVVNLCDCKRITDKGFELIIESLKGKNLKKMNVRNCGFSQRISEKYFKLLKNMRHFQHLDYGCNTIGSSRVGPGPSINISEVFLEMMSCNKYSWNLLNLWKCNIGFTTVFESAHQLGHLSTLTDLCLQENQLNDRDGVCIGEYMVTSWHSLRSLNLRQNNIGDTGAAKIFEGIRENLKLKTVFLDRNQIEDGDLIQKMVEYFVDQGNMEEMDVSYNEVPEYLNTETETRKFLRGRAANIQPCNGYTEISINNRFMRL
ncbi:uncharacterized protein LOC128163761 [Crassostrea angulata]|uniref:uncharacterized protein LOC128163761 n=1 Tax=Magallana angulata TaxID=2784310 RepID=UPI0022B1FE02|nr:uncharacterized protein LOC128163761 [Crassostrea angulata]